MSIHIITADLKALIFKHDDSINLEVLHADEDRVEVWCGFQTKHLMFEDAMDLIVCLVSGNPQLFEGDGEWIKELVLKIKSSHFNYRANYRSVNINDLYGRVFNHSQTRHQQYLAISASRLFYVVDLIDAFLYGGEIGYFETKNKKPKFKIFSKLLPLVQDDEEVIGFGRNVAKELRSMSFRKYLSGSCYDKYKVAFHDQSLDWCSEISGHRHNDLYVAQLCNFYKSENYSLNSKFYKLIPTSKSHKMSNNLRFSFYPILTVEFEARNFDENTSGYRALIPLYCFMAGCNSYSKPESLTENNFEFFCDRADAEDSIWYKYKIQDDALRDLYMRFNGIL